LKKKSSTDEHRWALITKASEKPLLLDGQDVVFRPVVCVVDDWFTNYRLGLVAEASSSGRVAVKLIGVIHFDLLS